MAWEAGFGGEGQRHSDGVSAVLAVYQDSLDAFSLSRSPTGCIQLHDALSHAHSQWTGKSTSQAQPRRPVLAVADMVVQHA